MEYLKTFEELKSNNKIEQILYCIYKNKFDDFLILMNDYKYKINEKYKDKTLLYTVLDDDLGTKYVHEILKYNPDLNIKCDNLQETVLHMCCRNNDLIQYNIFIEKFVKLGADTNIQNNKGNTPFMYLYNDKYDFIKLLKLGADPTIKNNKGDDMFKYISFGFDYKTQCFLLDNFPQCINRLIETGKIYDNVKNDPKYEHLFFSSDLGLL